jgi:hypothetical protein
LLERKDQQKNIKRKTLICLFKDRWETAAIPAVPETSKPKTSTVSKFLQKLSETSFLSYRTRCQTHEDQDIPNFFWIPPLIDDSWELSFFTLAFSESHHRMDVVRIAGIVQEIRQGRPSFTARVPGGDPVEGRAFNPTGRRRGAFIRARFIN